MTHKFISGGVAVNLSDTDFAIAYALGQVGMKVTAIKHIRENYNIGLKEAKDICDFLWREFTHSVTDGIKRKLEIGPVYYHGWSNGF